MSKRVAILIGVEIYSDPQIPTCKYASADAEAFAAALPGEAHLVISPKATRTGIASQLRKHTKSLTQEDELFLFYSGQTFTAGAQSYLACGDTDLDDLEETSLPLTTLFDLCAASAAKRIALFLDCRNGAPTGLSGCPENTVCFTASAPGAISHTSDALGHGLWAHFVIQALRGQAANPLTASGLLAYLNAELPRALRQLFTQPTGQTPGYFSHRQQDYLIADVETAAPPPKPQITGFVLRMDKTVRVNSLAGFTKGSSRMPTGVNDYNRRLVQQLAQPDIDSETAAVFELIREHMKYKRKDLTSDSGRILTPDFEFEIESAQHPTDAKSVTISRTLRKIAPTIANDPGFNIAFARYFDALVFEFKTPKKVVEFIDEIEDLELSGLKLTYPPDFTHCDIAIDGVPASIRIDAHSLSIQTPSASSPRELIESFFGLQSALAGSPVLKLLAGT